MLVKKFEVTKIRTLFWFLRFGFFVHGFGELFSPSDLIWLPDVKIKSTWRKKRCVICFIYREKKTMRCLFYLQGEKNDALSVLSSGRKSDTMQDRRFLTFLQSILLGLNDSFLSFLNLIYTQKKT